MKRAGDFTLVVGRLIAKGTVRVRAEVESHMKRPDTVFQKKKYSSIFLLY